MLSADQYKLSCVIRFVKHTFLFLFFHAFYDKTDLDVFLLCCSLRLTVASSSTAKRWWTSTSTAWSSPCRPTPSTSLTAPRSRRRRESGAPRYDADKLGRGASAESRGTRMSITTASGVCMMKKRPQRRRGRLWRYCLIPSRKTPPPAPPCILRFTSRTFDYTVHLLQVQLAVIYLILGS